jgi:hypothetical protein
MGEFANTSKKKTGAVLEGRLRPFEQDLTPPPERASFLRARAPHVPAAVRGVVWTRSHAAVGGP